MDTQVNPGVEVTFNTTGYYCVEFDIIVDAGSGMDGSGTYGNLQVVTRDASWAWASIWLGPVGTSYTSYRHVKRWFGPPDGPKVRLGLQLAASAPPYSSDVTVYIDNVVIRDGTPPAHVTIYNFNGTEDIYPSTAWLGGSPPPDNVIVSRDRILHPDGSPGPPSLTCLRFAWYALREQ